MNRIRPLLCVLALLAGCDASGVEPTVAIDGYWTVDTALTSHQCPELGSLAPVEPGMIEFRRTEATVTIARPGQDGHEFTAFGDDLNWSQSGRFDGCEISADGWWTPVESAPTSFVAEYTVWLTANGADCQLPEDGCSATYTIRGRR